MLVTPAFVPVTYVTESFEIVADKLPLDARTVLDYIEDTYIDRRRPGRHHRAPLFDLEL